MRQVIESEAIPDGYLLCLNRECPLANTCLRQLAEQKMTGDTKYWHIISPKYQSELKGECPDYRQEKKIVYAKGFLKMLGGLTVDQCKPVINDLIRLFGRRSYYRVRKGERLLTPDEQQWVLRVLIRNGVDKPVEFDAYLEDYAW